MLHLLISRLVQVFVLIVAAIWIVKLTREYRQKRRSQFRSSELVESGDVSGRLGAGENGNRK